MRHVTRMRRGGLAVLLIAGLAAAQPAPAQIFDGGSGFPGGGNSFGFPGGVRGGPGGPGGNSFGFPAGPGFPGGTGVGQGAGRQGGVFSQGGFQQLSAGQTVRLAAFCTDLMADPPDAGTRFTGGDRTLVALGDREPITLAAALKDGLLALRGRSDSFDPARRDGSLALDLYLTNQSGAPVRVAVAPATAVTPDGQAAQPLPEGADRLMALANARGLARANTMQFAVWAARGSTVEDVEQTNMIKLPAMEVGRVESLLRDSGLRRQFDRDRGVYAARYAQLAAQLPDAEPVSGATSVPIGGKATAEGLRGADGKGLVKVRVHQSRGEFYYRAEFGEGKDGRTRVRLLHLLTGRPMRANTPELRLG
jgi:hypothetical protein